MMQWANRISLVLLLIGLGRDVTAARQQFLGFGSPAPAIQTPPSIQDPYDAGLFAPLEDLSVLSSNSHTSLTHPFFPQYSVRIKKSTFCDGAVNSYTGYIDIGARHLFFYFFESRRDPVKDDVIFWTSGGPGCSSAMGLFMELGPCKVTGKGGNDALKYRKESWNEYANVFFVDQPVGVGFSYAENGESVSTTEEAAKDIAAFIGIFFEHFHKFKGRAFHMAGDSYGGRYVPLFASAIYDQNARLVQARLTPVNLTSIIIGNGMTDFATMIPAYYEMACTPASLPPILDISTCVRMKQVVPRCNKWLQEACIDIFDDINCKAAVSTCSSELVVPVFATGINPYDISRQCEGSPDDLCYSVTKEISAYLDRPSVRAQLGVDPSLSDSNFSFCNGAIYGAFESMLDQYQDQTKSYVAALLDRGVKALIYVGTNDWLCNWIGNENWTLELEWSGKQAFVRQELREWRVDGNKVGLVRSSGPFTFATVNGAGHMVPYDKPVQALELLKRWLSSSEL